MILRIIIFIALCYIFTRLLKKVFTGPQEHGRRLNAETDTRRSHIDEMVQDPVCKLYIPKREAVTTVDNGVTRYFCSRECRDKYNTQR